MAEKSVRKPMWPWALLILLALALVWYFFSPDWRSEQAYDEPIGTDVRDLEREPPVPSDDPGYFSEYDKPGEVNKSRPESE